MTVEETMNDIIASAKAGNISNHIKDETHEEWTIRGTEQKFRVVIEYRTSKPIENLTSSLSIRLRKTELRPSLIWVIGRRRNSTH